VKKNLLIGAFIALFTVACSNEEISDRSQFKDPWQKFILQEIDSLTKQNPKLTKTINLGDEVDTKVLDSVDWFNELLGFLAIDFSKEQQRTKYLSSLDSNGKIAMTSYYAQDTNALLQTFVVTRINGKVDLLTWTTKLRSFMMDRQQELAYQPGKGYRMNIKENSLWGSPRTIEIFGDIHNKEFLER
jgi:hypothetical protein